MADQVPIFVKIGTAFVNHYYNLFDNDRAKLASLYRAPSMLTFEQDQCQGPERIMNKLTNLKFQQVQHKIKLIDCQPSGVPNGILVAVNGDLKIDNENNPIKFSQVFHLLPDQAGKNYWVHNDIFRLVIG